MKIELPADASYREGWEVEAHDYRVVFWHHQAPPPGHTQEEMGYSELTYDVSGADDVLEVIEWAEQQAVAEDSTYCIYVKLGPDVREGEALVQIAGVNPTADPRSTGFRRHQPAAQTTSD